MSLNSVVYLRSTWDSNPRKATIRILLLADSGTNPSLRSRPTTPLHQLNGLAAIWEWGYPVISGLRGISGIRTHAVRRLAAAHPHVLLSQFGGVEGVEPISLNYLLNHLSCRLTSISDSNIKSSFNPLTPFVVRVGIEPTTPCSSGKCSTN